MTNRKRQRKLGRCFWISAASCSRRWDHHARKRAATGLQAEVGGDRGTHQLTFDTYEEGKLSLEEYLGRVIFYEKRPFTRLSFGA